MSSACATTVADLGESKWRPVRSRRARNHSRRKRKPYDLGKCREIDHLCDLSNSSNCLSSSLQVIKPKDTLARSAILHALKKVLRTSNMDALQKITLCVMNTASRVTVKSIKIGYEKPSPCVIPYHSAPSRLLHNAQWVS